MEAARAMEAAKALPEPRGLLLARQPVETGASAAVLKVRWAPAVGTGDLRLPPVPPVPAKQPRVPGYRGAHRGGEPRYILLTHATCAEGRQGSSGRGEAKRTVGGGVGGAWGPGRAGQDGGQASRSTTLGVREG